jgi:hypothetical protein
MHPSWFAAEVQLRSRNGGPEGIDRANRTLLREYAGVQRVAVTRAWPVRGGLEAWRAEVLACRRWSTWLPPTAPLACSFVAVGARWHAPNGPARIRQVL